MPCELACVTKQIEKGLSYLCRIRLHSSEDRIDIHHQIVPVFSCHRLHGRRHVVQHFPDVKPFQVDFHLADFDFGIADNFMDPKYLLVNAKAETAAGLRTFKKAFASTRCLAAPA